jgi:hypothetical protein
MPLLTELVAFYVTVSIKISLLRSWSPLRDCFYKDFAPPELGPFFPPEAIKILLRWSCFSDLPEATCSRSILGAAFLSAKRGARGH